MMATIVNDSHIELTNQICGFLKQNSAVRIIALDGFDGSGKSTYGKGLCDELRYQYFDIDGSYLVENQVGYIENLMFDNLLEDVTRANSPGVCVLDGICMRDILDRLNITASVNIYFIKKKNGQWGNRKYLNYDANVDEIISQDLEGLREFRRMCSKIQNTEFEPGPQPETLTHEIIRYHHKWKPNLNADIIYKWDCN